MINVEQIMKSDQYDTFKVILIVSRLFIPHFLLLMRSKEQKCASVPAHKEFIVLELVKHQFDFIIFRF